MFSSYKNLTVIGIAKDGHVIYGPYLSLGLQVTSGFYICNGMFYDSIGNYGYFATTTYPYITGCFGPGNYPSFAPICTTNPPAGYTKSSYATSFSTSNTSVKCRIANYSLLHISYNVLVYNAEGSVNWFFLCCELIKGIIFLLCERLST
jgi:hypothetical protein